MSYLFKLADKAMPEALYEPENRPLLTGILRGVEKESLRVSADGLIAMTPHPIGLGSALTHPQITTDFSEALLEFITPPSHQTSLLIEQLDNLHRYTYPCLERGEMLWTNSMPCAVGDPATIPVAHYGTTNRGKMKTIYRVGLGHRYGRTMQTVAGVHFNFSLPNAFWAFMHQYDNSPEQFDQYRTRRYFELIRNFRRHHWLLMYLFGASPALCRSFVDGRIHNLNTFEGDEHTLYRPYATSLRMSDLGYQSAAQERLYVCYNSQDSYIKTLGAAISTPYAHYEAIGLKGTSGEFQQLNTSLLQIENEFYSTIRPKRTAKKGETALTALCRRGVEYIEVRCLDLNPFSDIGITEEQIHFLDTFLLYCALQQSPPCGSSEFRRIAANQKAVSNEGRKPGLQLLAPDGETLNLRDWGEQLLLGMEPVAALLDHCFETSLYRAAWESQLARVHDTEKTLSAKVLQNLRDSRLSFFQWAKTAAEQQKERYLQSRLSAETEKKLSDMAEESLRLQQAEEEQPQIPFESYLNDYYRQYQEACEQCAAPSAKTYP